jgi:hypothetical protein
MRNYIFDVKLIVTNNSPTVNLENNISISGDAKNVIINQSNESIITINKLEEFIDDHRNELDNVNQPPPPPGAALQQKEDDRI